MICLGQLFSLAEQAAIAQEVPRELLDLPFVQVFEPLAGVEIAVEVGIVPNAILHAEALRPDDIVAEAASAGDFC